MNVFLNLKTAEKCLQFGATKCKTMLIGKSTENIINTKLLVDKWEVIYEESDTGEEVLVETYVGQVPIEEVEEQRYLGFVLSSQGNNMVNINSMKMKSKGIIRRIFSKLEHLKLQKYYAECAIIFLKVMLRSSILYGCETYYNLKENEIRSLEMIEEGFLRELVKTGKGCPLSQLYAEFGLIPARYEIIRIRLLYLKEILIQNEDSMIFKMFQLQLKQPKRGDWASTCLKDLGELKISMSLVEIQQMTKYKFSNILKERISENAGKYLTGKKGKKGKEINFNCLEMAEYLKPTNDKLTISEKQEMFSARNRMTEIGYHFPKPNTENICICGEKEDMVHIYNCELINQEKKPNLKYENIFNGDIQKQIEVFKHFKQNLEKREEMFSAHVIPKGSAVFSNVCSNG